WVLDTALASLSRWARSGIELSVAVNVSSRLLEDRSIEEIVGKALASSRAEPGRLTLEITEGIATSGAAGKAMQRLAEMGVRLSLDDFGTGYSSLVFLKRLPVRELKIDRSFIKQLPGDPDSVAIVRTAIGVGHNLGLRVIGEGVEDRDAEALLVEAGCDAVQGFLIGHPVPEQDMTDLLESGREVEGASSGPPPNGEGGLKGGVKTTLLNDTLADA